MNLISQMKRVETKSNSDNEEENTTKNNKIPRKGRMVISEDKYVEGVKLRLRGKTLDMQYEKETCQVTIMQ